MQKIIKLVDEKRGIMQCTFYDERWYARPSQNEVSGMPEYKFVPSVTWIAGHYPKGIGFYKWLADKGWDEAEAIKSAAGDKGSKVHLAISAILAGEEVRVDSKFINPSSGQSEELTPEEVECIKSFIDWRDAVKPESIAWDVVVYSDKEGYAGSIDYICRIEGQLYIIDFKTSQSIWREMEMQISAYRHTVENGENPIFQNNKQLDVAGIKTAILQIGYRRNKDFYKFTEVEDAYPLFLNAKAIWARETAGQAPRKRDFPIVLSKAVKKLPITKKNEVSKVSEGEKVKK